MIRGWSTIPTRSFRPIGCPASPFEWKRFRPIWIPSKRKNFPPRKMRTPRISSTTRLSKNCPRRDSFPKEFGRKILSKNSSMMALETARKSVSIHRSCKTKVLFCMVLCLKLLQVEAAPGAEKFRIASGGFGTAIHAVLWAAYHKNIFQKYDLDAEYIAMQSGTTAMQMLLAGELQSLFSGGPQPINANLQGADVTIIAGGLDFFPYKLIVRPDIKGANQLNGKSLGITSFGSVTELATRMALEKLGVNLKQVTILPVQGSLTRYAALQGGSIKGTMMLEPP